MIWSSYRKFVVDRIVDESRSAKSVYLLTADGKSLAPYAPGQHLPLRLTIPGQLDPVFRFYTLSDCDTGTHYRLTIKKEPSPADRPDIRGGISSTYIHEVLRPGDLIEAKAPAGNFFLDLRSDHPVVLIAGGIGVTPILSMLNAISRHQPRRPVWFFFALRNSHDHVFREHLHSLSDCHPNMQMCVLYDQPGPEDRLGFQFNRLGRVDAHLLQQMLPSLAMEYYICGPEPMMRSVVGGLTAAGVDRANIRTESFGPLSKACDSAQSASAGISGSSRKCTVTFQKSAKTMPWDAAAKSLWHFAGSNGVEINSGCLYGDCGTCLTRLLDGKVSYLHPTGAKPDKGACLPCSCTPDGSIVLDA